MTYLLDVNMLLALTDPMHTHHQRAHQWFGEKGQQGWATCPITENGYVRIASHSSYPNRPGDTLVVIDLLKQFCMQDSHQFWYDDISIRTMLLQSVLITNAHITDIYLLALAKHQGSALATFDRRIDPRAIEGGIDALEVIEG